VGMEGESRRLCEAARQRPWGSVRGSRVNYGIAWAMLSAIRVSAPIKIVLCQLFRFAGSALVIFTLPPSPY